MFLLPTLRQAVRGRCFILTAAGRIPASASEAVKANQ
ncbi:exported hypothetical protein [Nitrospira lenta]|uniref:Uncharacterized protein n=1 Tax=Nitrospira lenta TaxID=1436998 RepID=A0A330L3E4_9BACT|nr:exported hypothetical protein [Nitrospira lenta]